MTAYDLVRELYEEAEVEHEWELASLAEWHAAEVDAAYERGRRAGRLELELQWPEARAWVGLRDPLRQAFRDGVAYGLALRLNERAGAA